MLSPSSSSPPLRCSSWEPAASLMEVTPWDGEQDGKNGGVYVIPQSRALRSPRPTCPRPPAHGRSAQNGNKIPPGRYTVSGSSRQQHSLFPDRCAQGHALTRTCTEDGYRCFKNKASATPRLPSEGSSGLPQSLLSHSALFCLVHFFGSRRSPSCRLPAHATTWTTCWPGALLGDPRESASRGEAEGSHPRRQPGQMPRAQGGRGARGLLEPRGAGARWARCRRVRNARGTDSDPSSVNAPQRVRGCACPISEPGQHVPRSRAHVCPGGGPRARAPSSSGLSVQTTVLPLSTGISVFLGAAPMPPAPTSALTYRQQVVREERSCPLSPHAGWVTPDSEVKFSLLVLPSHRIAAVAPASAARLRPRIRGLVVPEQ